MDLILTVILLIVHAQLYPCQPQVETFGFSLGDSSAVFQDSPRSYPVIRQRPNSFRLDYNYREQIYPEEHTPYRIYTGYFRPPFINTIPLKYPRPQQPYRRRIYPGNQYRPPLFGGSRNGSRPAYPPRVRANSYAKASDIAPRQLNSAAIISRSLIEGPRRRPHSANY